MFATLFVNYLVIECEEAESHRLNYHSWRATGGLIVYRRSGDVGMRKEGDRERSSSALPPPCFPVSFVNCPPGQCVPIVFFFSTRVGVLRKTPDALRYPDRKFWRSRWNYDFISIALREMRHLYRSSCKWSKAMKIYVEVKMINARLLIINF